MDCLIPLLSLCLFSPSALSIEAQASWKFAGTQYYFKFGEPYTGSFGRIAALVDVPVRESFRVQYGWEHRSAIESSLDSGEERAVIGFQWRPFARR